MADVQPVFSWPYGDARDSTAQHGYKYDVQDGLVVDLGRFFVFTGGRDIFSLPDETSDISENFTLAPNTAWTCSNMMCAYIYPVPGQSGQNELI
jgi:hypothetical protein